MSDSIADFAITGKAKFGDFFNSFMEMTARMLMQMAMLNSMKAAFGGQADGWRGAVGNFLGLKVTRKAATQAMAASINRWASFMVESSSLPKKPRTD